MFLKCYYDVTTKLEILSVLTDVTLMLLGYYFTLMLMRHHDHVQIRESDLGSVLSYRENVDEHDDLFDGDDGGKDEDFEEEEIR